MDIWLITTYDGMNTVEIIPVDGKYDRDNIIKFAVEKVYNSKPFSLYAAEQQEEDKNWKVEDNMLVACDPDKGDDCIDIYCFNHIPDISIEKKKVEEI